MKKIFIAVILLIGCGCAAHAPKTDDRTWISVSCSGHVGWDACHNKARELCPHDYDIASKEENLLAQKRTMLVSCKK